MIKWHYFFKKVTETFHFQVHSSLYVLCECQTVDQSQYEYQTVQTPFEGGTNTCINHRAFGL